MAPPQNIGKDETVQEIKIEEEMRESYIDYAMSVIVARALPSVEDGLKPVQRRILYAMYQMSLSHNKPTKKSARIVGDCMGKYHPHGDIAIYDALVRMAQSFSLRYPLIQGQGNFGSIDADPPAAMRYTEARLQAIAEEILQDLDKKTVKMIPNFDNSLKEPEILPGKPPNLLINGATGIAVGMATNMPPHNITEVIEAIIACIRKPKITIDELMKYIKGPDFPTAGSIHREGISEMYKTGRGSFIMRGKAVIEHVKGEREAIIITELPYQVNKAELIKTIARLVQEKRIQDIADIRDESAKDQIRVVLFLRRGTNSKLILNKLFKLTLLETKFHAIMLGLVAGQPKILNLKQFIECYIKHRLHIVRKRTQYELQVTKDREHILSGLIIALKNLDSVITLIKKAKGVSEATSQLMNKYKLSQKQAQAILDMKLQKLTQLEQDKLKKEFDEIKKKIKELEKILGSEQEILNIIIKELYELRRKYGDERKTKIIERIRQIKEIDLIKKEDVAVLLTSKGYIKRMPLKVYQEQRRGGKGITGTELTIGDFVQRVFVCNTHHNILFLTERGKLYTLKAYDIPSATRYSKGKALINLLQITDKIKAIIPLTELKGSLFIATKRGIAKRVSLDAFIRIKKSGVKAVSLPMDDGIVDARVVTNESEIILATKKGIAVRCKASDIREMGKAAYGVITIKLDKDDEVIGLVSLNKEEQQNKDLTLLTITEKGYGKRSLISDYRRTSRACKGIININCSERNGKVIGIQLVTTKDSIIVTTLKGMVIRVPCKDIRVMGRNTQGVRIIRLRQDDRVADLVKVQI
ncbi:MAG: DNA gyrase subunit A [Candidatus Pacearchaeota archaeon]|nr:MAG: DNA gyrase subunit A [Candidatus Pacearchaeota archaeon]